MYSKVVTLMSKAHSAAVGNVACYLSYIVAQHLPTPHSDNTAV